MEKKIVMINGCAYDAFTGAPVSGYTAETPTPPETEAPAQVQAPAPNEHISSTTVHATTQKSSTLNRHYVRKTVAVKGISATPTSSQQLALAQFRRRMALAEQKNEEARQRIIASGSRKVVMPVSAPHPRAQFVAKAPVDPVQVDTVAPAPVIVNEANEALRQKHAEKRHLTPEELKQRAIQDALERTATINTEIKHHKRHFWQDKRFISALSMSTAAVILMGYLVYLNMPNISIKVAAMRAGIEATYPNYRPSGYSLKGLVTFDHGSVNMKFSDGGSEYILSQQKSSWDSMAVLNNYVKPNWGGDFNISKEHGLIIYTGTGKAAWVNGGVLYTIDGSETLTSEQIRSIAVSM